MAFWQQMYFGNDLLQYALFFGTIVAAVLLGKIIAMITEKVARKKAEETESSIDDHAVDVLERPLVFLLFAVGFYVGKGFLTLSVRASEIFSNVTTILFTVAVAWFVLNITDTVIVHYIKPMLSKDEDKGNPVMPLVRKLSKFVIIAFTAVMIIDNFGYDVTSLIAGLGLGGLALALAAKDLLGNLFGGVAIATDKPFLVGDRIKMGSVDGYVRDIGLRTSRIETFDGTMLAVPNSELADSVVENVSSEPTRRVKVEIGVEYGTSSKKVEEAKQILQGVCEDTEGISDESRISFWEFGDSALKILFIYYIEDKDDILGRMDAVNTEVKKRFEKADIGMAFPTRTVHLEK